MQEVELQEIGEEERTGTLSIKKNMAYLKDIEISLEVRVGSVNITVSDLFGLQSGSVLSLDKLIDEPVEVLLKGNVVARGRLAVVDDCYGVEISEISDES